MSLGDFLRENHRFLIAGGVLTLTSSYGQTYFIAIFAAQIMAAFGLTDGQWGLVYTIGTTASALCMFWAGVLTDRFRARALALYVMLALAVVCLWMSFNTSVAALVLIVFFLRLFGQGMMSQIAVVAMARWFTARRGLALSISSMGFALGQSIYPMIFAFLLISYSWRSLWVVAAALVVIAIPLLMTLLKAERTPQSLAEDAFTVGLENRHWTRSEVLKTPLFWMLMPMWLGPPAWGTAMFFQQVHIAEVKGWPLVDYLALLPLLTSVSVASTIVCGQLIDRFGSGLLARLFLVPYALSFLVIGLADDLWMAAIGMMLFGVGAGVQATLPGAFWAEYFGTRHIGAIKAVSTSIMVLGSAIGPGISGLLIDLGYSYPDQMLAQVFYFIAANALVLIGLRSVNHLRPAAKVDVKSA